MAKNLTPDQIAGLPADTIKVEVFPQAAVHFLSFNQKVEALQPEAVWEAARYLVDYKGMTDTILNGQMETHQAFWPKGFPGSLDETPFAYDPAKAKQILADAGVTTPISVTLDVINSAPFTDMAQSLQASFAEAGINFEILPGTGSQVITKYRERSHEAMLLYWGLGSGTHNQKMTVAAMQMALMKVWAQRSYRVAMRRQSLSLPNIRSMRLRCL